MLLLSVLLRLTNGFLTDSGAPAGAPVIFGPAASTGVLAGRFVLPPSALLRHSDRHRQARILP